MKICNKPEDCGDNHAMVRIAAVPRGDRTARFSALSRTLLLVCVVGCGESAVGDDLGQSSSALSICDEAVPTNRYIDGIPAYSQCSASNGAVYSNNGVDTSSKSGGTGWIRTQYSGGYQCTELAHRYLLFHWNVQWEPKGNAGTWCETTPPANSGVTQTTTPVHGDLIIFSPGTCGVDPTTGHVAVVDSVDGTKLTVLEQNPASRRSGVKSSCATCFLHVVANDGSPTASDGGGASAGADGTAGTAGGRPNGGRVENRWSRGWRPAARRF